MILLNLGRLTYVNWKHSNYRPLRKLPPGIFPHRTCLLFHFLSVDALNQQKDPSARNKKKKWFLSQKFTVDSQGKMYQNLQLASWPQIKFLRMAHTKRILLTCFFLAYTRSSANGWNAKLSVVVKGPAAINYKKEISNK